MPLRPIADRQMGSAVVEKGQGRFDLALAQRIERLVNIAEYKRRQSAPGVKITRKAFGLGRRYPITNGYRDTHVEVGGTHKIDSKGLA